MAAGVLGKHAAAPAEGPTVHSRRDDIQGLRAVAVLVVVTYHAGFPFVNGGFVGVDLFFVLSGFLITQLLLREIAVTGTVNLREFWARRARRILPVSVLVLGVTMLSVRAFMSPLERGAIGTDVLWSALFSGNWRFAQQQTDYLASDRDPSPVLHYWSLGVEEQFYLVWPLLLIVLAVVWRRAGRGGAAHHLVFGGAFVVVIAASLAYCVHTTSTNQPYAFFGTPSRAWQLAAGALTALAVPAIVRWSRGMRAGLGVAGLVLLGSCVLLLEESGSGSLAYPSWLAVIPTLAGMLLVASGTGPYSVLNRLFAIRPLTYVGDISFSLYLWHWPVLVIGVVALDDRAPETRLGLLAFAVLLSVLSFHLVENPVRRARPLVRRPALSIAVGAALVVALVPVTLAASATGSMDRVVVTTAPTPGVEQPAATTQTVTPALQDAATDVGPYKDLGCHVEFDQTSVPPWDTCTFGKPGSDRAVVVLGDSIAGAIGPGVVEAGKRRGWAVTVWAKSRCAVADVTKFDPQRDGTYEECDEFREAALKAIEQRRPDVVVLAMSRLTTEYLTVDGERIGGRRALRESEEGLRRTIDRLRAAGIGVVISDSPHRAPFPPTTCLAETGDARQCRFPVNTRVSIMREVARQMSDEVSFVEANATVCPDGTCQPVVGSVVVYRDAIHFTRTFALTLAGDYERAITAAMRR
ncbi:MAG: acyltransferase 3 [Aeromicrobium sp.]|nr:acyltransferase 3 [Aeromicrobium sp.]